MSRNYSLLLFILFIAIVSVVRSEEDLKSPQGLENRHEGGRRFRKRWEKLGDKWVSKVYLGSSSSIATDSASDKSTVASDIVSVTVTSTAVVTVFTHKTSPTSTKPGNNGVVAVGIDVQSNGKTSLVDVASSTTNQASNKPTTTGNSENNSNDHSNDQSKVWVDAHNAARAKYGAPAVVWDEQLAAVAKEHAYLCNHAHTKAAENLQWGSGFGTPQGAVDGWMEEASLYDWNNPGYSDEVGHFTQVVWKDTGRIGCYIAPCPKGSVVSSKYSESFQTACEYDPAGNYVNPGEFAKNVGVLVS
ncbi:uncharacterized protein L203_102958 [Cryptococcus depauperatus CBS 7841]|uniref:SCP domain-containing protein n=1 Tax=Cryptococcus depauperatus CBS 7841 TaxID=1295531 RepID=A0AAJ8M170_9TREE